MSRMPIVALVLLSLHGISATAESSGRQMTVLALEPADDDPRALSARVEAPAGTTEVRLLLDGVVAARDGRAPFRARIELGDRVRERWIEAVAVDGDGRELDRDARAVDRPADRGAVRLVRAGGGDVVVHVAPPPGSRVSRVLLRAASAEPTTIERRSPPWRFAAAEIAPFGEGASLGAIVELDDGSRLEDWELGLEGAQLDVRRGEARFTLGRDDPAPEAGRLSVRHRGRPQRIVSVAGGERETLELGLLIDVSGSTRKRFEELRSALAAAEESLIGPGDRTFLGVFAEEPLLLASGRGRNLRAHAELPAPREFSRTDLFEALAWSITQFHREDPRAALVVLTDGCASDPPEDYVGLRRLLAGSAIPVHVLLLDQPCVFSDCPGDLVECRDPKTKVELHFRPRLRFLQLARASGGSVHAIGPGARLDGAWTTILSELGRQWLVVFEPDSDRVRSDEVEVRDAAGRILRPPG